MRISIHCSLRLAALVFAMALMPIPGRAQIYDAASSFEHGLTTHSNPNGVWRYGYSTGFLKTITLYNQTAQCGVNGLNAQCWLSSTVNNGDSPAAEYNNGPAYNDGNVDFLKDEFLLVSGIDGQYSDLVFTAPAAGTYSIVSQFRGAQYNIGVVVGVVVNGVVVFSSKATAVNELVPFKTTVKLAAGNTVVFSVGPGGGLQNTGLSATITDDSFCVLQDSPSFNATTGILTMKFNVATPTVAIWNGWLADQNALVSLWSESLAKTEPPVTMTKTKSLAKSGVVGILSTLTTRTGGIACSSWVLVNSGTP
jgi:hypothetical protein